MTLLFRSLVINVDDTHGDGGTVVNVGDDGVEVGTRVGRAVLD